MKILVTGGAGFIGSHLCERLLGEGHKVVCVDNFYTGTKKNIAELLEDENFELITHDIVEPLDLKVDQIYNLACPASPIHYQADPIKTAKTSVLGSLNLLELAERCGARILQASTSEVYGDPQVHPQAESYWGHVNPIGIRSCYDEGKRMSETLFFDYHRERGVDVRVIRIFNTYGPKMAHNDGRVVSNFITQALAEKPITIYGDGSQTRSFCYVDDLVDGIVRMMNQDHFIGPVNLGNPIEKTVKDLSELVIKMSGSRSQVSYKELPQDDPLQRKPDISLAREKLGWIPKVDIHEGLKKTIEYFNSPHENSQNYELERPIKVLQT